MSENIQDEDVKQQIISLDNIEKKIITLLSHASKTVSLLSVDDRDLDTVEDNFEQNARAYLSAADEIQISLRSIISSLSSKGILLSRNSGIVNAFPYGANVNGFEKDLELVNRYCELIKKQLSDARLEAETESQ